MADVSELHVGDYVSFNNGTSIGYGTIVSIGKPFADTVGLNRDDGHRGGGTNGSWLVPAKSCTVVRSAMLKTIDEIWG